MKTRCESPTFYLTVGRCISLRTLFPRERLPSEPPTAISEFSAGNPSFAHGGTALAFVRDSFVIPHPAEKQTSHLMRRGPSSFRRALYGGFIVVTPPRSSAKIRVVQEPLEVFGRGRLKNHPLPADRMLERDAPGVQRLSRKGA